MHKRQVEIINKLGLHARASAKLTQTASSFASEVWLERSGRRINAKSIMGVMMLAAAKGVTITIETDGPDEDAAMNAILGLIEDKFGEGE
ncbi:MAG: HPr family phosphocarrier protein [Candidatus Methylophosphatis roskildensis]|uniref:HPr family phosphocarrier protein n=1 Tax=Candidatus Methylophosphatis roskildensis TaxID=2899263 RepID=A0A9D7DWU5_9PROT|nr:HPr family phosphocarrier protein [Candidatus Methylophosphatis roskildensis]MBK7235207.1 HPr family phosphocarrier protein [Sterolibacteriaceae bacterium]MBK7662897.1 HPr family phosphocarrier protein [Sterolibacteriaceae bacterium]MBK9087009.1 HPr family phosphocarrier protein [Sterolibacteriaceae bacterium]